TAEEAVAAFALLPRVGELQQLLLSGNRRERIAAADYLAVTSQVRNDSVALLSATPGEAKAGHNLIEHKDDSMAGSKFPQRFQKSPFGLKCPLKGLHDHRGQVCMMTLDDLRGGCRIVERGNQHIGERRLGNAVAIGHGLRKGRRVRGRSGKLADI